MTSSIGSRFLKGASMGRGWMGWISDFGGLGRSIFFDCLLLVYFVTSGPLWWRLMSNPAAGVENLVNPFAMSYS
jgi:hypothetical protein